MRIGIATKFGLLTAVLVSATVLATGYLQWLYGSQLLVDYALEAFSEEQQRHAQALTRSVLEVRRDVLFLSQLPTVQGVLRSQMNGGTDPETGLTTSDWKDQLAAAFTARLRHSPSYLQLRLIAARIPGMERVRVERLPEGIIRTPEPSLLPKGQRGYHQATVALAPGEVYLSPIELNQERGQFDALRRPTLRGATPVTDAAGNIVAILVLNLDFGQLLDQVTATDSTAARIYVTNEKGQYLIHPEPGRALTFEFGDQRTITDEIPELTPAYTSPTDQTHLTVLTAASDHRELVHMVKAFLDPAQPGRFIAIVRRAPVNQILAPAMAQMRDKLSTVILLAALAAICAVLFTRWQTRPLHQITLAARQVNANQADIRLPTERGDEIGILARALDDSRTQIALRERALQENQQALEAILDTVHNGIATINEQGIVQTVNPAVEKMFGYSAKELIGKNIAMLMPEYHAQHHDDYLKHYMDTGERRVIGTIRELTGRHKDGHMFPFHLAVSETSIQGRRVFVGALQDLSQLKESQERTRRLGEIVASSSNEIHMFDADQLGIVESNLRAVENLGISQGELRQMSLLDLFPKEEQVGIHAAIMALQESPLTENRLDALIQRRDGSRYPAEIRLFISIGRTNRVGVMLAQDISERQQQLEHQRAYAQQLESSNRELREFAYVASHDLQEPLRKVQTFGDRLREFEGDRLTERGRDYLARMTSAAARMQQLIRALLSLSRVTTGAGPFSPVNLGEVAAEAVDDLETRIVESGAKVEIGALPVISADRVQMRQLLQNLISNALKFHRNGDPPVVQVSARLMPVTRDSPAHYEITVQDNGIGFEPHFAERIFQPFERLHSRESYEGTGMGLALCRKIVERHGGSIKASGQTDAGAVFTITLPVTNEGSNDEPYSERILNHRADGRG